MRLNNELTWWAGKGGDAYLRRNEPSEQEIGARAKSLSRILVDANIFVNANILEVGAGPGANLRALISITRPAGFRLFAVEPNEVARRQLEQIPGVEVYDGHAGAICAADNSFDMCMTAGVLIHIHPNRLVDCMREIVRVSKRYVLAIEYFAPKCEPVVYYGAERIWRNDFGRLYVEHCGLRPVAHGFFWREANEGYDNTVWHLLEKL